MNQPTVGYTFNVPGYRQGAQQSGTIYKNYIKLMKENEWMKVPLVSQFDGPMDHEFLQKSKIDIACPDKVGPPSSAEINYIAACLKQNKTSATELRIRANIYFGYRIANEDLVILLQSLEGMNAKNLL